MNKTKINKNRYETTTSSDISYSPGATSSPYRVCPFCSSRFSSSSSGSLSKCPKCKKIIKEVSFREVLSLNENTSRKSRLSNLLESKTTNYYYPREAWPDLVVPVDINSESSEDGFLGRGAIVTSKGFTSLRSNVYQGDYEREMPLDSHYSGVGTWNDDFDVTDLEIHDQEVLDAFNDIDENKDDFSPDEVGWALVLAKRIKPTALRYNAEIKVKSISNFSLTYPTDELAARSEMDIRRVLPGIELK